MAENLPDSLSRWLHFIHGDDHCTCDWTWRRKLAEWELSVLDRDCPHHGAEYGVPVVLGDTP